MNPVQTSPVQVGQVRVNPVQMSPMQIGRVRMNPVRVSPMQIGRLRVRARCALVGSERAIGLECK
jgi:hypothetical protein